MERYAVHIRKADEKNHYWVLTYNDEPMCFSPMFNTETKCIVEALFFGTVFGVDVKEPVKPRNLTLLKNPS